MPALTVILLNAGDAAERDWVMKLLSGFDLEIVRAPDFSDVRPGALYIYYNDRRIALPQDFLDKVAKTEGAGLMHLGDEYYRGDFKDYAPFAYVIRNSHAAFLEGPGMLQIPIGHSNNLTPLPFVKASERAHLWSFAGARREERVAMVNAFLGQTPHLLSIPDTTKGEKHIPRSAYLEALSQSVFVPSAEGNIMLETARPYEALEYGAIPIIPKRGVSDQYRDLLGVNPLPAFETWAPAVAFMQKMASDKVGMDRLQAEIVAWWSGLKGAKTAEVTSFIERGRRGEFRAAHKARFSAWNHRASQPQRLWELAKQQSATQVGVRLNRLPKRIAAKLQGKSTTGVWTLTAHSATDAANTDKKSS